jgi:thioester reductase-like protein
MTTSRPAAPTLDWCTDRPVLLTGATGFLGAYLLHAFLTLTDRDVFVTVRAKSVDDALSRVGSKLRQCSLPTENLSLRVRPILADLGAPESGLGDALVEELADSIGLVVHAAARVHHALPYEALRAENVSPLVRLLGLAARGATKPTAFISSMAVFEPMNREYGEELPDTLRESTNGYICSKVVCERLVATAREQGLPVRIFRPSLIFGTRTSPIRAAYEHAGVLLMRAMAKTRSYPQRPIELDAVPVDAVAKAIVTLSARAGVGADVFNVTTRRRLSTDHMMQALSETGYDLRPLALDRWLNDAARVEPLLEIYRDRPTFSSTPRTDNTTRELARLGSPMIEELPHEVLVTQIEDCRRANEIPGPTGGS